MLKLLKSIFLISFVLFFCPTFVAAEDITITTYYPSPYGSYKNLTIYNQDESTTQTDFTQGLTNAGIIITTDYTDTAFTPGIFWTMTNSTPTTPKAGIYLKETSIGTNMYLGTSNNYATGITNNALVIDPSGNVGIGKLTPGYSLEVSSSVANRMAMFDSTVGASPNIGFSASGVFKGGTGYYGAGSQGMCFVNSSSAPTLMVTDSGNVGIGTTAPTYRLQLSTDSAGKPTTNTWTIVSDRRIKKNISDFTDGLDIVMKLKPRTYQYNGLGGMGYNDSNAHIGFVAQEIESIAPYMVETGIGTVGGAQVSDFKSYQGHALPFILVNAIQEQQDIIKAQQLQIDELKARLDKLE